MPEAGKHSFSLGELAGDLGARVVGDPELRITGLGSLEAATSGQISHFSSHAYREFLRQTAASAVILAEEDCSEWSGPALIVGNTYLAFARVSQKFARLPQLAPGVHATAIVAPTAQLPASVAVGPGVVIGERTVVGENVCVHANTVVGADCVLSADGILMASVVIYDDVVLGERAIVHSGAVIGADGFGFAADEQGHMVMIAQLGGVRIGDDVNIGACSTIDRGAIDHTIIADGVKIDNHVQVGHNCHIGAHTVICGCAGMVGSTRIGRHCVIAGGVGIAGDGPIEICDGVVVSATTHVSSSITEPGIYSGGVLHSKTRQWKRNALRFMHLDELNRRVTKLEKKLRDADK